MPDFIFEQCRRYGLGRHGAYEHVNISTPQVDRLPDRRKIRWRYKKMSSPSQQHRDEAPDSIQCAVVTISDTRTFESDLGGQTMIEHLQRHSHQVTARHLVADEPEEIRGLLSSLATRDDIDAILMTGGTGISRRDQTYETVMGLLESHLPGYGELFRMLSYEEIGAAAMLSRATGGLISGTVVLTMPGSPKAVQLAMEKIILPELGHLVREARR